MPLRTVRQQSSETVDIGPDEVRVGKDVIELVTSGMYVFPVTIYREYIQNAADAIDEARRQGLLGPGERGAIDLQLDHLMRTVVIRDNGCGLRDLESIPTLLAIGGSPKRGTGARGFRGVGRLSGLAYCQELEFRTKAHGTQSVLNVLWDCRLLRSRLADPHFKGDIRQIIAECTEVWYETATNRDEHFFEVRMRNVSRHRQDMLLNEKMIGQYLAQVAPLSFSDDFSFGPAIETMLADQVHRIPCKLTLNGEEIRRPYRDETKVPGGPHRLTIKEIEFINFADVDGAAAAVGWLGHHEYIRSISTGLGVRGLRARIGDVQIGEENLLDDCFKEPRFNGWTMGEIHVIDPRIIPNARRDNFELNHHAYNLITQIGPIAAQIAKHCRSASVSRNSALIVRNTVDQIDMRLDDSRPLSPAELSKFRASILRCRHKLKGVVEPEATELSDALAALDERLGIHTTTGDGPGIALDEALALVTRIITNRDQANKLVEALREICG